MLCLRFSMAGGCFGLDAARIVELIPWVELWELHAAPGYIRGCFNYRGRMTPALDLSALCSGRPSQRAFSSRIAVLPRREGFLGVILEGAVETFKIEDSEFQEPCLRSEGAPFLGRMALKDGVLLQIVEPEALLTEEVRRLVLPDAGEGAVK
jgi:chemotaxis-related protein WspB